MNQGLNLQSEYCATIFESLLSSRQAGELLHVNHKTLERWAKAGAIPGYQFVPRGQWLFRASELDEWLRSKLNSVSQSQPDRVN